MPAGIGYMSSAVGGLIPKSVSGKMMGMGAAIAKGVRTARCKSAW